MLSCTFCSLRPRRRRLTVQQLPRVAQVSHRTLNCLSGKKPWEIVSHTFLCKAGPRKPSLLSHWNQYTIKIESKRMKKHLRGVSENPARLVCFSLLIFLQQVFPDCSHILCKFVTSIIYLLFTRVADTASYRKALS